MYIGLFWHNTLEVTFFTRHPVCKIIVYIKIMQGCDLLGKFTKSFI